MKAAAEVRIVGLVGMPRHAVRERSELGWNEERGADHARLLDVAEAAHIAGREQARAQREPDTIAASVSRMWWRFSPRPRWARRGRSGRDVIGDRRRFQVRMTELVCVLIEGGLWMRRAYCASDRAKPAITHIRTMVGLPAGARACLSVVDERKLRRKRAWENS